MLLARLRSGVPRVGAAGLQRTCLLRVGGLRHRTVARSLNRPTSAGIAAAMEQCKTMQEFVDEAIMAIKSRRVHPDKLPTLRNEVKKAREIIEKNGNRVRIFQLEMARIKKERSKHPDSDFEEYEDMVHDFVEDIAAATEGSEEEEAAVKAVLGNDIEHNMELLFDERARLGQRVLGATARARLGVFLIIAGRTGKLNLNLTEEEVSLLATQPVELYLMDNWQGPKGSLDAQSFVKCCVKWSELGEDGQAQYVERSRVAYEKSQNVKRDLGQSTAAYFGYLKVVMPEGDSLSTFGQSAEAREGWSVLPVAEKKEFSKRAESCKADYRRIFGYDTSEKHRIRSGYQMFVGEQLRGNADMSMAEVGSKWKELSEEEKAEWAAKAKKVRYSKDGTATTLESKPKPVSAWSIFVGEHKHVKTEKGALHLKEIGRMWRSLSDEEKKKYAPSPSSNPSPPVPSSPSVGPTLVKKKCRSSGYHNFVRTRGGCRRESGELWSEMSLEEREKYGEASPPKPKPKPKPPKPPKPSAASRPKKSTKVKRSKIHKFISPQARAVLDEQELEERVESRRFRSTLKEVSEELNKRTERRRRRRAEARRKAS
eukprot:Hpha_TRINITY_DN16946_c1_g5::TRINITY_DN16946_c1_g5_i1::g.54486::m.54486